MREVDSSVRVALVDCTGLLGDVIRQTLSRDASLYVVAHVSAASPDLDFSRLDADVVLWNNADEEHIFQWLAGSAHHVAPRVLAVMTDGRRAALWELTPHRIELGDLSPQTLINTIRDVPATRP